MSELREWNTAAANNNSAPPNGAPENMNYSAVNDTMREMMAVVARYERDTRGGIVAGGTANAITVTPVGTYAAYFQGMQIGFEALASNTGATTLNVGGVGATALVSQNGAALQGGEIVAGGIYQAVYDGTNWQLRGTDTPAALALGGSSVVDLTDSNAILRLGPGTGQHLEADANDIQSKSNATTAAVINVNPLGGNVNLGAQSGTGRVNQYFDGALTVYNVATGLRFGSVGNGLLEEDTGLTPDGILLRNLTVSGLLYLQGQDSGDAQTTMFRGNPDGAADLYYDGEPVVSTETQGMGVRPTTAGANPLISLRDTSAVTQAEIGYLSSGIYGYRSFVHGAIVALQGEDTGGTNRNIVRGDPDGSLEGYHIGEKVLQTRTGGVQVWADSSNANPIVELHQAGGGRVGFISVTAGGALTLENENHGQAVSITAEDTGGTGRSLFSGTGDGGVTLYYAGAESFGTASVGAFVQHPTAASPELELRNSSGTEVARWLWTSNHTYLENKFVSGLLYLRGTNSVSGINVLFVGDPDGAVSTYYDGDLATQTSPDGLDVYSPSSSNPILDVIATSTFDPVLGLRGAVNGGLRMYWDESASVAYVRQTTAAGAVEDVWLEMVKNDKVALYFNGTSEIETQQHNVAYATSGGKVKDHAGTLQDIGFNVMPVVEQDTATTLDEDDVGKMLHRDGTASMLITLPSGTSGAIPPVGALTMITNENATGALTIAAAGTLRWFNGAGTPSTGTRTLAEGGVCSVYHYANAEWWIWGNGLS